jgi:hypothetical protein
MRTRLIVISAVWLVSVTAFASGPSFTPDYRFTGSSTRGWHSLGKTQWTASQGVITGTPESGKGGWLVLDDPLQDISVFTKFRCEAQCETGLLLRAEKTAEGGLTGVYVSFTDATMATSMVTVDASGEIVKSEKLPAGGGLIRVASTPSGAVPPARPRPQRPNVTLPLVAPDTSLKPGDWNFAEVFLDANTVRSFLNNGPQHGATTEDGSYGPIALHVGGRGAVHFSDTAYADMSLKHRDDEKVGPHFKKQRLSDFYYSWGTAAADFNHDGITDVISGPYIYYGPDYKTSREIYYALSSNPVTEFNIPMEFAADFTGDGWADVIVVSYGGTGSNVELYVNPRGEKRRWQKFSVGSGVQSEIALVRDIDGDGKPELVYCGGGHVRYAKPNPADPTAKWDFHNVSADGYGTAHGIGVGDVNGDGRLDIVSPYGWWEQPASGAAAGEWQYHPQAFARFGRGIFGGSVMAVYDVNGDGLNDVVTSLDAHGWGLAWYEQKRSTAGAISFIEHMVMDDLSTKNAGGVAFSEIHGTGFADIDGDGIPDFIAGKRYMSHLDTNIDPDPRGAPVLYWYRTVRSAKAPGGAELIPELIDTHTGVGSDILAQDLNNDGAVDIVTSTRFGTFIYWGIPKKRATISKK